MKGQILISENTWKDTSIDLQIAGRIQIEPKGIKYLVTICENRAVDSKYNLFLPNNDEKFIVLNLEVPVEYTILQGGYAVGTVFIGALISLFKKEAQLRSLHYLKLLSNLKLKLLIEAELSIEEHIYAKVIQQSYVDEYLFAVYRGSSKSDVWRQAARCLRNYQCTPSGWVRLGHQC